MKQTEEVMVDLPAHWPNVLKKACYDYYDYVLGLSCGRVIAFTQAYKVNDNWVRLDLGPSLNDVITQKSERETEVNVSQIAWIADGSVLSP